VDTTGLGTKIREIREGRGLSHKDVWLASGVHPNTQSGIETGKHKPRPSTLQKLAEALDVSVEDLTGLPKDSAPPSADERRFSYLRGFEALTKATATRLQVALDSEGIDLDQVNQVAQLHEDLQKIATREIGLLRDPQSLPREELLSQEKVAAALDDLRSVIDEGYMAAINNAMGRRAEVQELGKLQSPTGASHKVEKTPRSA
jgi:transcriptional regulator with XRE-family HTH domain